MTAPLDLDAARATIHRVGSFDSARQLQALDEIAALRGAVVALTTERDEQMRLRDDWYEKCHNVIRQRDELLIESVAAVARAEAAEAAHTELCQAVWDAYRTLGFDTDGDPTPAAVDDLAGLIRQAAATSRHDYDEACDETTEAISAAAAAEERITAGEQRCEALIASADSRSIATWAQAEAARSIRGALRGTDTKEPE